MSTKQAQTLLTTDEPNSDLFKFGSARLHLDAARVWHSVLEALR
jgi:hypothetical protein